MPRLDKRRLCSLITHTQHNTMTVAKNTIIVLQNLKNLLLKSDTRTLRDTVVMVNLGFSPQSWRVWRPPLIEICDNELFSEGEYREGYFYQTENYKISYDKKLKIWKIIQQPLMKKKNDEDQLIPMTKEDHEKLPYLRDSPINY